MPVHSTHMVNALPANISAAQFDTLNAIMRSGMGGYKVCGQDPYSRALITEVYPEKFHDGWDHVFGTPIFTIVTATGMTYCPYS
jgi:hypothetical protein